MIPARTSGCNTVTAITFRDVRLVRKRTGAWLATTIFGVFFGIVYFLLSK